MAGLTTTAVNDGASADGWHTMNSPATGTDPVTATSETQELHLDSFFEGSGWSREDVKLVVETIQVALLVYLVLHGGTS